MRRVITIVMVLFAVVNFSLVAAGSRDVSTDAPEFVFRAAHGSAVDSNSHRFYTHFKNLVEEYSDGRIKVDIYPGSSLASGAREEIEMSQRGELTFSVVATTEISRFGVTETQLLDMPFLFENVEEAYAILNDGELFREISDTIIDRVGIVPLFWHPMGFMQLISNHEIRTPQDLRDLGLLKRTMESESVVRLWRALGSNPTPMAWGELYTALEQGTVDAMSQTIGVIYDHDFHSVQSHMSVIDYNLLTQIMQMSKQHFDRLPSDLQEAVLRAGRDAGVYATELLAEADRRDINRLADEGMTIIEITPEERSKWVDAAQPAVAWMSSQIGESLVERFFTEIEAYRSGN